RTGQAHHRLRSQAAAKTQRVAAVAERRTRLLSEADAERSAESVVGNHDPRLDQHLLHRSVKEPNDPPDLFQSRRRILHEQDIGPRIDERDAAARDDRSASAGSRRLPCAGAELLLPIRRDDLFEVGRLHVVELERLHDQWLELADLDLVLELLLLPERNFLARRNQNDVAVLAHVEALGLHDDVERLVPRHVLQPQRKVALYGVARDDVQASEISDHLQDRANVDVLEIERQLLALIAAPRTLCELVRVFLDRLDFDDELVIRLIRRVLPQALRLDHHPC